MGIRAQAQLVNGYLQKKELHLHFAFAFQCLPRPDSAQQIKHTEGDKKGWSDLSNDQSNGSQKVNQPTDNRGFEERSKLIFGRLIIINAEDKGQNPHHPNVGFVGFGQLRRFGEKVWDKGKFKTYQEKVKTEKIDGFGRF